MVYMNAGRPLSLSPIVPAQRDLSGLDTAWRLFPLEVPDPSWYVFRHIFKKEGAQKENLKCLHAVDESCAKKHAFELEGSSKWT